MNASDPIVPVPEPETVVAENNPPPVEPAPNPEPAKRARDELRGWWIKLCVQPLLFLACGVTLIVALGVAQRTGFISAGGGSEHVHVSPVAGNATYICPMMCTPPQAQPGRCPVCAMELVPATAGGKTDSRSIQVDPATRRVANIQTVAVTSMPVTRTIRAIGELRYDEGTLKTISAYVDGRLERLYADYTGVVVKKGDHLALLYSPSLYSGQVELLLAKKARGTAGTSSFDSVYASAQQRLIEMGMTAAQIEQLEKDGEAKSRLHLCAPNSGTVIEKLAVEGQYVKEGDAIYRLADLSTVWLMLRLFPEDAAAIRYGQKVEAEVQSLPGRTFVGRVAFVDPSVDAKTRTVGIRVVIPNTGGSLRVGDYAKARIDVPLAPSPETLAYDPELANKWISPRHPHVIADSAGKCPICGVDLVPATHFGFAAETTSSHEALVVPRDAVLMTGPTSVVYVETDPGRFEIRRVVLGPACGDQIVIQSGVKVGEQVATRGNFLIDSQMQLAGNPSLIDPTKAEPTMESSPSAEQIAALSKLSPADRKLAEQQRTCPVADHELGSMGTPKKVDVKGTPVFICCEGCRERLLSEPDRYLAKLANKEPKRERTSAAKDLDLPPMGTPQLIEPDVTNEADAADKAEPMATRSAELHKEVVR